MSLRRHCVFVVATVALGVVVACASQRDDDFLESVDPSFGEGDAGASPDAEPLCPSNRCPPFHLDCNGDAGDGCEANIRSDVKNCGACGTLCALDGGAPPPFTQPACIESACAYQCITDLEWGPMRNCTGADPTKGDPVLGCPNQILCDPFNCGGCGIVAPLDPTGDRICASGVPLAACPAGTTNCHSGGCGGQCKNLNTDSLNCGACGRKCPDPSIPSATVLALEAKHISFACDGPNPDGGLPTCVPTCKHAPLFLQQWEDCDGDFAATVADPTNPAFNGCEVNAFGNVNDCGKCGNHCAVVCHTKKGSTTGEQVCDCPAGRTWCASPWPGDCVDTDNDPRHCGSCAGDCPGPWDGGAGNPTCIGGKCGYKCKAGWADCNKTISATDGCEVNTQNFPKHCGACGRECRDNQRCGNGECLVEACSAGPTK